MSWVDDVREFHLAFGQDVEPEPTIVSERIETLRVRLMREELDETVVAMADDDLPGIADGLADLIYVSIGTALAYGIPLERVWDAVHAANMAKLGPDGKPIRDAGGKVVKPAGWTPPDIAAIVGWESPE